MIFSVSEYLGFTPEEVLEILSEDGIEITAIREPQEFQKAVFLQRG
ncbi:MAG: hypothetical protein ABH864_00990 [archaeon]